MIEKLKLFDWIEMFLKNTVFCISTMLVLVFSGAVGLAQDILPIADGCTAKHVTEPARVIYKCENGLVFEVEAAAQFEGLNKNANGVIDAVTVSRDAVLIELPTDYGPFQINTPHAIAAVRGTIYVIDVLPENTSVFVVRGVVAVSRTDGSQSVDLKAGDGVVMADGEPVVVKQWGEKKVADLLARFAR